jgi:hypothetical protein
MAEVKERVVNRREFCIPNGFLLQGKQRGEFCNATLACSAVVEMKT